MQMAAQDALDLPIAGYDLGKGGSVAQPVAVHMRDAGGEGRVVHQDYGRPLGGSLQRQFEPSEPLCAQQPAMLTWNVGVERHDAQRVLLDRIVKKPGALQVSLAAERLAHALARIVVAGDDEERHYER